MFESVSAESVPERLRNAAVAPMAAFLFAQLYFALYPLFTRVPAALFWSVDAIVLAGAVVGAVAIARVARAESMRGRAAVWLVIAIAVELLCAWLFLALTFPWL
jgi:hypothetical protein